MALPTGRGVRALLVMAMAAALVFWGEIGAVGAAEPAAIVLRSFEAKSGVDFRFYNGSRGKHDLPEIMGGGVALIDGDGDGWLDLFLCNGGPITAEGGAADPPCRYFRNVGGRFHDETAQANVPGPSYAMGAAVGDFNGDGRDDLFVTGWRGQRLYRNEGGGRFQDVTERAGVTSTLWSTSAAFADLDRDGDLDLYVVNYLEYDPATAPFCAAPDGRRDYCAPEDFSAQVDRLYCNNGDGTFTDVAERAGIDLAGGRGLGVLVANLVGDDQLDIFVANDGSACWLFENKGSLRFEEVGLAAGVSFDGDGKALAAMGTALGDLDGDGLRDLVVTNFYGRSTVAFRRLEGGTFQDASNALGLTRATRGVLGFGIAIEDFDGDGWLDLIEANGHVLDRARLGTPFAMKPTLLRNVGRRLVDVGSAAGPEFARERLGRGLATGDLNHDGRPDVVVSSADGSAVVLENGSMGSRWLTLDLRDRHARPAVGARIKATVGGREMVREVVGGGSYLSASDPRITLGLGSALAVDRVEVRWPSGKVGQWRGLKAGQVHRISENAEIGR